MGPTILGVSVDACNGPHLFLPLQPTPSASVTPIAKYLRWRQR